MLNNGNLCKLQSYFKVQIKGHSTPGFKVTPFFDAEYIRNGTTYRHDVIEILIGTYTRRHNVISNDLDDLESDLAKYSTTRSVERSLCDS